MMGIVIGSDSHQEWLLPWWWDNYSLHNAYPVAIFDFGMSREALAWCREKWQVLSLPSQIPLRPLSPHISKHYKNRPELDHFRAVWFKKPLALLHSPFPLSLWVDLDCEVKGNLSPLFSALQFGADISLVEEPGYTQEKSRELQFILPDEITYNCGIIAFKKNVPILHQWIDLATKDNSDFLADQDALSRAIYLNRPRLFTLPSIYNWKLSQGHNEEALILHYAGSAKSSLIHKMLSKSTL